MNKMHIDQNKVKYFRKALLSWFEVHRRDFPWRREGVSNFELIMSEVLLQRTRAETVAKYYPLFFGRYPDWDHLVAATDEELQEILQPLGLYKHRAARIRKMIDEYKRRNGALPRSKGELNESSFASLYLSNAYELFILKKRAPLLDVNMSRVLRRYFMPKIFQDVRLDKEVQELANKVINVRDCTELNWAVLDFSALVCKASTPRCEECLLKSKCSYYAAIRSLSPTIPNPLYPTSSE